MSTGMIIDGVFASQAIDSSGEILDIEGCDISTLDVDGVLNYEHKEGDKKLAGAGNNGEEIVGKILYAHRVMKESDCETDRQKEYWRKVGHIPFIYGMCRLYDGAGHSGAKALAAQIRDHHANGDPILVRFSIEGATLDKKGNRLVESVARRVAATLKPCNRTAVSGLIEDPRAPEGFEAKPIKQEQQVKDILAGVMDDHRDQEDTKKRELEHPSYKKLGGVHEVEVESLIKDEGDLKQALTLLTKLKMLKALSAGTTDAAPSTLTGGAALQREDHSGFKNRAMAALRDYGKKKFDKGEFKQFVKAKMPEADDQFIDHFADIAEDYHVKRAALKKGEEEQLQQQPSKSKPKKAAKPKKVAAAPAASPTTTPPPAVAPQPEPVAPAPTPKAKGKNIALKGPGLAPNALQSPPAAVVEGKAPAAQAHWDAATGSLVTEKGTFKANYNPEHWDEILSKPEFQDRFDAVMNNWKIVNDLRQKGVTIPGETAIAAMMGGYSANELVPVQEMAIQHTLEALDPESLHTRPPTADEEANLRGKLAGKKWPETNQEWFLNHDTDVNTTKVDREQAAKEGKSIAETPTRLIGKPEDKIGTLNYYHRLHPFLHELMKKHGMNGSKIVADLIKAKDDFNEWKAKQRSGFDKPLNQWRGKRERELKAAGTDPKEIKRILSEEGAKEREKIGTWGSMEDKLKYAGPIVEHLSNKTLRYMVGMLGYGDSHVPDTHFVRHFFGLDPRKKESTDISDHLKDVLLDPKNAEVLNQIDEHYRNNHPAAKWVQKRYFNGKADVHSTFPAFWAHWLNIVPNERAHGMRPEGRGGSANEESTHAPYWWAVANQMKKHGIPGWEKMIYKMLHDMAHLPMQVRVANALHELHNQFGPTAATIAYYHSMVPALLDASNGKDHSTMIRKLQAWTIDLRKAAADLHESKEADDGKVYFAGKRVVPGLAHTGDGDFELLHENRTHYIASPVGAQDRTDCMVKFPKDQEGTHYKVSRRPTVHVSDLE